MREVVNGTIHSGFYYISSLKSRGILNTLQAYHHDLKKLQGFLETQELDKITNLNETGLNSFILFWRKKGFPHPQFPETLHP